MWIKLSHLIARMTTDGPYWATIIVNNDQGKVWSRSFVFMSLQSRIDGCRKLKCTLQGLYQSHCASIHFSNPTKGNKSVGFLQPKAFTQNKEVYIVYIMSVVFFFLSARVIFYFQYANTALNTYRYILIGLTQLVMGNSQQYINSKCDDLRLILFIHFILID